MSLNQVLYILWRRIWIVALAFASTSVGAAGVMLLVPARYDAVATASIDPGQAEPVSGEMMGGSAVGLIQGNLVALAKSNQVALNVVKQLNLANTPQAAADYRDSGYAGLIDINLWMAGQILKNLDAKFELGSNVIQLTYKSPSARQSSVMANGFLAAFIDAAIAAKGSAAQETAQWFEPQIDKLRTDLATARDKLARFQVETKLLSPTVGDSENDQLLAVTNGFSTAKSYLLSLQSQLAGPADAAAESNDAQTLDLQTLTALRASLSTVNTEIGKLQTEVGANNPKLVERLAARRSLSDQIDAQIAENRKKLVDRIEAQKGKIAFLEKARADQLQTMIGVQTKRDELASLTRDVQFHQDEVDRAERQAAQAHLRSQLSFSNISIVDKAAPPTSVAFPKPLLVTIAGVGLGIALGLILALLAEALDRTVRSVSDLEFVASVPVLGTLAGAASRGRRFRLSRNKAPLLPQRT